MTDSPHGPVAMQLALFGPDTPLAQLVAEATVRHLGASSHLGEIPGQLALFEIDSALGSGPETSAAAA